MELSLGSDGLYQRPGFRGQGDSLGSSLSIAETSVGFKMGRTHFTLEANKRAAQAAKAANVKPARLYLRSTSRGLRRAVDIYMPLFKQDESPACSEGEQEEEAESQPEVHQTPPPAPPQEELSYRRTFSHFQRLGMWKLRDFNGAKLPGPSSRTTTSSGSKKLLSRSRILGNFRWD